MPAPAADPPDKPLWDGLKALIRLFAALFGQPADLLDEGAMRRSEARLVRGWLRGLERIARALLLVMAAQLPPPPPGRARRGRRAPGPPPREEPPLDGPPLETPPSEAWAGVAFRALPPASGGRSGPSGSYNLVSTRPYAYRFEAIIRVAERPGLFARRLARRLRMAPALVPRLLREAAAEPGAGERPWSELAARARSRATAAARVFPPDTG
jgi:hypothetical protein